MNVADWPKYIVKARKYLDYTQEDLAERLGVPLRLVKQWEDGEEKPSKSDHLAIQTLRREERQNRKKEQDETERIEKTEYYNISVSKPRVFFTSDEVRFLKELLSNAQGNTGSKAKEEMILEIWQKL